MLLNTPSWVSTERPIMQNMHNSLLQNMTRRPDHGFVMSNPTSLDAFSQLQQHLNAAVSILSSHPHPAKHSLFQLPFQQILEFYQVPYLSDQSTPSEVPSGNSFPVDTITTASFSSSVSAASNPSLLATENNSSNIQFPFGSLTPDAHGSVDERYASFTQPPAITLLRQPANSYPYLPTSQEYHSQNFSVASNLAGNSEYLAANSQGYNKAGPEFMISSSPDMSRFQTQQGSSVTSGHGLQSASMTPSGSHDSFITPNSGSYGISPTTEQLEATDQAGDEYSSMPSRSSDNRRSSVSSGIANTDHWVNQQSYNAQRLQNTDFNPLSHGDLYSYQPPLLRNSMEESGRRAIRAPRSASNTSSLFQVSNVRRTNAASPKKRKHCSDEGSDLSYSGTGKAVRKKYDEVRRLTVAETRKIGACMRCSRQRIGCITDPEDPEGECVTCQIADPKKVHLGCLRHHISIIILFRREPTDEFKWTRQLDGTRLKTIESLDTKVKHVYLTQGFKGRALGIPVREYDPQSDILHYEWKSTTRGLQKLKCTPYVIANPDQATKAINDFLDQNFDAYLSGVLESKSPVWRDIFNMARKRMSRQNDRKDLYYLTLRLWIASRLIERPWEIIGQETLGMRASMDDDSPYYKKIPVPPAMDNQFDRIVILNLLDKLRSDILRELENLHKANKKNFWQDWFKEFLCSAIMLNNYELATRHDVWFAKHHNWPDHYSNPKLLEDFLLGAKTVLAHFHYTCNGERPFSRNWSSPSEPAAEQLDEEQRILMTKINLWIAGNSHNPNKPKRLEDDLFLMSQLFKEDWQPQDLKPEDLICP